MSCFLDFSCVLHIRNAATLVSKFQPPWHTRCTEPLLTDVCSSHCLQHGRKPFRNTKRSFTSIRRKCFIPSRRNLSRILIAWWLRLKTGSRKSDVFRLLFAWSHQVMRMFDGSEIRKRCRHQVICFVWFFPAMLEDRQKDPLLRGRNVAEHNSQFSKKSYLDVRRYDSWLYIFPVLRCI